MEEMTQRQGPVTPKLGGRKEPTRSLAAHGGSWHGVVCDRAPVWLSSGGPDGGEVGLHFIRRWRSMAREMVAVLALTTGVGVNLSGTTRMWLGAGE
jgi:hypothetical protein